jgi:MFS family permease
MRLDFGNTKNAKGDPVISAPLLGFLSASYQLGSIIGVPFAPYINQKFGRRWPVFGGSVIMVVGSIIQGFAQDRMSVVNSMSPCC